MINDFSSVVRVKWTETDLSVYVRLERNTKIEYINFETNSIRNTNTNTRTLWQIFAIGRLQFIIIIIIIIITVDC